MKKSRILVSFKDRKFKYGGYAALLTGIVIALLAAVNLLVDQIPARADLTRQKLFTLSDQTLEVLKNLDRQVMIYGLFETGKEPAFIDEILQKYRSRSKKV